MDLSQHPAALRRSAVLGLPTVMSRSLILFAGLAAAIGLLFWPTLESMIAIWSVSATYGHGFLIPPIAGYLVWTQRHALARTAPEPSAAGLVWLTGSVGVWLIGHVAQANVIQHFAFVGLIQGAALTAFGWPWVRLLLFPLGYLLLMVPFGDFAIRPLQWLTAEYTTALLRMSGVPVLLEGWVMTIPGGAFLVAEACAGVRFLIACVALGVLIAGLMFESWAKRLIFVALSILVPIGANVIRAYGIVMIAVHSDFQHAVGVDHLIYGFIFLSFVMMLLIGLAFLMRSPARSTPDVAQPLSWSGGPVRPAKGLIIALLAVAILAGVRGYGSAVTAPAGAPEALRLAVPEGAIRSIGPDSPAWHGAFTGADVQGTWAYETAQGPVSLFMAYYADQSEGRELISYNNSLAGPDRFDTIAGGRTPAWPDTGVPKPQLMAVRAPGEPPRWIWYWYWVGDRVVTAPRSAKILDLRGRLLFDRQGSGVLAVSTTTETPDPSAVVAFLRATGLLGHVRSGTLNQLVQPAAAEQADLEG
ncbi:MAG: exosortase A [Rhodothalassiaceae bacterium]